MQAWLNASQTVWHMLAGTTDCPCGVMLCMHAYMSGGVYAFLLSADYRHWHVERC